MCNIIAYMGGREGGREGGRGEGEGRDGEREKGEIYN